MKRKQTRCDRRSFLQTAAPVLAALLGRTSALRAGTLTNLTTPDEFRKRLLGPILSFPTPYTRDFKVDQQAVRNLIERALKAGVTVVTLTAGNNQYGQLTYDEIKALTRLAVETVAGRGIVIGATGPWWTGQAVDYARFAASVGADAVQVLMSPHAGDDGHLGHYKEVAAAVPLGLVLQGHPSLALMKRLQAIDSLVAVKEEFTSDYTAPLFKQSAGRLNIFAGGTKARFLAYQPYGMRAYYSAFATFAPEVAMRFWEPARKATSRRPRRSLCATTCPSSSAFPIPSGGRPWSILGLPHVMYAPPRGASPTSK